MNRFVTSDGLGLAWSEEGAGLPLLCLPGLTRNGSDFDELAAAAGADPVEFRLRHLADPRSIAVVQLAAEASGAEIVSVDHYDMSLVDLPRVIVSPALQR